MKFDAQDFELVAKYRLTPTIYDFRLKNEELAAITVPGQFVHVLVPGKTLRRPISVCDVNGDIIRIVFEVRGEGTEILAESKVGDSINMIAPLGKGFDIPEDKNIVLIGGGIGVPPMLYSAHAAIYKGCRCTVINGFRDRHAVILSRDFTDLGAELIETTDDGSYGVKGFVTTALEKVIESADLICACGPTPMLKNVSAMAALHNVQCFVSLEQRMACGVGACLGCAVGIKKDNGSVVYKHVCKNGPVFRAEEVAW